MSGTKDAEAWQHDWQNHDFMGVVLPQDDIAWLVNAMATLRPDIVVEIGSWSGGSTGIFADYAQRVYCVDHWHGNRREPNWPYKGSPLEAFQTFARNMGPPFLRSVFPCVGGSATWASVWNVKIDFLFIDGCHDEEEVRRDIAMWTPHVRIGGWITGHDYNAPGVQRAVAEAFGPCPADGSFCIWAVRKELKWKDE